MNKLRRKSDKSRRSSSRSVISISGDKSSGNDPNDGIAKNAALPPTDISLTKWREIINDEEEDSIVNSIREEIIRNAMEAIYIRYLKKTSYDFVVHCSHRAWSNLLNVMYLKRDPGENVQTIAEYWSYDNAPDPIPCDAWACRRLTVRKEKVSSEGSEICTATSSTDTNTRPVISVPSFTYPSPDAESSHNLTKTEEVIEEKEESLNPDIMTEKPLSSVGDGTSLTSLNQRQASERSIFTRTISMVKDKLPVTRWQSEQGYKDSTHVRGKNFRTPAKAIIPPERLDLGSLPPDRYSNPRKKKKVISNSSDH